MAMAVACESYARKIGYCPRISEYEWLVIEKQSSKSKIIHVGIRFSC